MVENELLSAIDDVEEQIGNLAPNMKAVERLEGVEGKFQNSEKTFDRSRRAAKTAREKFVQLKQQR